MQALRQGNWNLDLASPRLQATEQAKYDQQKIARYNQGEENVAWDPTTWHNIVGARKVRMQGLSQANEPWNLDNESRRLQAQILEKCHLWCFSAVNALKALTFESVRHALQEAEKKKYYELRKERYERGETSHGKYPASEDWIMPSAHGARKMGLYQQVSRCPTIFLIFFLQTIGDRVVCAYDLVTLFLVNIKCPVKKNRIDQIYCKMCLYQQVSRCHERKNASCVDLYVRR